MTPRPPSPVSGVGHRRGPRSRRDPGPIDFVGGSTRVATVASVLVVLLDPGPRLSSGPGGPRVLSHRVSTLGLVTPTRYGPTTTQGSPLVLRSRPYTSSTCTSGTESGPLRGVRCDSLVVLVSFVVGESGRRRVRGYCTSLRSLPLWVPLEGVLGVSL